MTNQILALLCLVFIHGAHTMKDYTIAGSGFLAQEHFCDMYNIVVRGEVVLAPVDHNGNIPEIESGPIGGSQWIPVYLTISKVYKDTTQNKNNEVGKIYNAFTREHDEFDTDLETWQFGPDLIGQEFLFYFDSWDEILLDHRVPSITSIPSYHKNMLNKGGFDCSCDVNNCYNRVTKKKEGIPKCITDGEEEELVSCVRDSLTKECTWKGAKRSCVNVPVYSNKKKRLRKF
eukprot:sb/3469411/